MSLGHGVECAIICGVIKILELSADNLDCQIKVYFYFTTVDYSITNTIPIVFRHLSYVPERASIRLNDVNCTGDEASLLQCPHNGVGIHECDEAAVGCYNGKPIHLY